MRMGDGKPKLFKYVYASGSEHVIDDITLLAEGDEPPRFQSTEQAFRTLAEKYKDFIPDAVFKEMRFYEKHEQRRGCYWNSSYLFIPITETRNYYKVGYFS